MGFRKCEMGVSYWFYKKVVVDSTLQAKNVMKKAEFYEVTFFSLTRRLKINIYLNFFTPRLNWTVLQLTWDLPWDPNRRLPLIDLDLNWKPKIHPPLKNWTVLPLPHLMMDRLMPRSCHLDLIFCQPIPISQWAFVRSLDHKR